MLRRPPNLFLIGPMGAGKSTVGRALSQRLEMTFIDLDEEIERRTGADIAWIFDVEGESGFRLREQAMLAELTEKEDLVLATGGGAILSRENRNHLAARGLVIYLQSSVSQQIDRTLRDKKRPLIQDKTPEEKVEELTSLMAEREPLYAAISDFSISTDKKNIRSVVESIIQFVEKSSS